jgi:hypothetical protein
MLVSASALHSSHADADTTAPVVVLTSLAAGSTLTEPVVVSASTSDDVGVVAVLFWLDGGRLGPLLRTPPYVVARDGRTAGNGNHTLSVADGVALRNTRSVAGDGYTSSCAGWNDCILRVRHTRARRIRMR